MVDGLSYTEQSDLRFRQMFERHNSIMLLINPESGEIVDANVTASRFYGYPLERLLAMNIAQINTLPPDEIAAERIRAKIENRNYFIFPHRLSSGEMRTVEVHSSPVETTGKTLLFSIIHDITERKIAEQKSDVLLRRQQALMRSALEGIHIMDAQGNIVETNDTFCQMLGYTREEMSGLNVADWDAQWSREELMERFKKMIHMDGALFETRHRRKDGSLIEVEVSTTGTEIDGQFFLYASSRDITERMRNQEMQRIAAVTFDTQEAIMITTPDAKILRVNQAFHEITGYSKDEVVGHNPRIFQSGRHDAAFYQAMWSALHATGKWSGEIWDKRRNGSIYPKLMTITAVYDNEHKLTH